MNPGNFFLILIGRCVQYVIYVYFAVLLLVAGNTRFNIRLWSLLFSWITARSLHFNCHIHDNTIYFEIASNYGYSRDWIFTDFQHFLDIMVCYSLRYSCSDVIRKNYTNSNLELNGMKLNLTELNQVITKN